MPTRLPVEEILDTLKQTLTGQDEVVLEAPPGAGKTTLVPLALLDEPWLAGKKILMLEPRRIAAKSAAHRMATLLNETAGQTVGYRMRLDTKVSKRTRIEVITEGILTRMLQHDPSLENVGLVIFDEFHERNLDSDLALALCLKGRTLFRDEESGAPPLKLLLMSATLNSKAISQLLSDAPIIKSEGKAYPVNIIYGRSAKSGKLLNDNMVATIQRALLDNPHSSILAFLPGQREIRHVMEALSNWLIDIELKKIYIRPLYGNLSLSEQQQAIAPLTGPHANGQKVVLATNIAETSLTIEGIDIVVDSGLVKISRFSPATGMNGLHTTRISQASSIQRAGRAGRLQPGKCYRLWSAEQQAQLETHAPAEIMSADLAPLALQLLQWGIDDPQELQWLDLPPSAPWQQALDLLNSMGALNTRNGQHSLTPHGQAMALQGVHPRLAHLLICGAKIGFDKLAAQLAGLLSEHDPFSRHQPDIRYRLDFLSGEARCPAPQQGWLSRSRMLVQQFSQQLKNPEVRKAAALFSTDKSLIPLIQPSQAIAYLLACAYPDRIARRRHSGGYQLSNGRSAKFIDKHPLGQNHWLVVGEVSSSPNSNSDIIRSATALDEKLFNGLLSSFVRIETVVQWDKQANRFIAEEQEKVGALILSQSRLSNVPIAEKREALLTHIRKEGLKVLPWTKEHIQWCGRVMLIRKTTNQQEWPDVTQTGLLANMEDWLGPYLDNVSTLQGFKKLDLSSILQSQLPWEQQQRLKQLAPTRIKVPSGSSIAVDYTQSPPVLAVKLQEMFGCEQTPTIVDGKVPLLVHLLSPAGRPLQITQDLAGFWQTSYHEVKRDMKGRYPKHPWPDNPLEAPATAKTKARLLAQRNN
uniref:ATP-dependent helicase HrpB n=1 Tax=uncultured Thiotrichaceae bacterium TaxID=298394 RepID=A0A6S6UDD8_9GAMM|nr:MAG: ATP-dependent helicase HrpB [uncultured Thiotrichaceae bacterium]